MNKYVIGIAWSQTDHEHVLVEADTRTEAVKKVKEAFPGIHHVTGTTIIQHQIVGE